MIRSLFFAPANRPDLLAKFPRFGADCNVIDLEDGTQPADKARARGMLAASVDQLRAVGLAGLLTIRVNVPDSEHFLADLDAALATDIDGVVLPKFEDPAQLRPVLERIQRREQASPGARKCFILGGLESARGIIEAVRLCAADPRVTAVYFGAEDFATDIGARRTPRGDEVYFARSQVILAAKAARITALDQAVTNLRDDAQFLEDAGRGRDLGYDGKICVLPRQVTLANEAFSPSAAEVEHARRVVDACARAEAAGKGTADLDGQIIEAPILRRAEGVLAIAARIAGQPTGKP